MNGNASLLLEEIYREFSKGDARALRKINDKCIECLGMTPEKNMLSLAVISYVLSKILSKPRYFERRANKEYLGRMKEQMQKCAAVSKGDDEEKMGYCIEGMLKTVDKISGSDRRFFLGLQQKALLKIAATLYAQGFSLGRASEITGVEEREILKYAGGTMMFDRFKGKKTLLDRLNDARKIFAK
ncbi:hypothetical protein COV61_01495 [Candidatus Micrarchaeota archaeon CG11_big_fil_rev_8_21_14_0_20_47_5]|nr:MAG: hypothetical protein AUJ17_00115 [Candidatus Micrarchaeota archaeon CG1_02_47_40]PIN83978.1 MAG: hypothetical protein COV61_01495 [Candidatus Micrarchaeota archaeon CG11_big_fil_rev_8_21_14_0_20_47_5]